MQTLFTGIKISAQLCLICFLSFSTFSQLDSAQISIHFETEVDPEDANNTVDAMHIDANIYSVASLGQLVCAVYQEAEDYPIARFIATKTELEQSGALSGGTATLILYDIDPAENYRIETYLRNQSGANIPVVITNYNGE